VEAAGVPAGCVPVSAVALIKPSVDVTSGVGVSVGAGVFVGASVTDGVNATTRVVSASTVWAICVFLTDGSEVAMVGTIWPQAVTRKMKMAQQATTRERRVFVMRLMIPPIVPDKVSGIHFQTSTYSCQGQMKGEILIPQPR
jgi:hypothetical protein